MTTIAKIQRATADHFGLPPQVMTAKGRETFICRPRQIGMYLACRLAGATAAATGRKFRRHHTTVVHAVKTIERLRRFNAYMEEHNAYLDDAIDQIIAKLKEGAKYTAGMLAALALLSGAAKADDTAYAVPCALGDMTSAPNCLHHTMITGTNTPLPSCPAGYELLMRFPDGGYSGGVPKSVCAKEVIDAQ